jgi:hypothetical protein
MINNIVLIALLISITKADTLMLSNIEIIILKFETCFVKSNLSIFSCLIMSFSSSSLTVCLDTKPMPKGL